MATPVGTFTAEKVISRVLSRIPEGNGDIGVEMPTSPLRIKILNELNFQIAEVYKKVSSDEIELYYVEVPVTFVNNLFNLRSISDFEGFIELREALYGSINKTSTLRLETLFNSLYYDDCFACSTYGDFLKLFIGNNLTTSGRTFFLKYLRLPNVIVSPAELVDIPDNYIEKIIDSIVNVFSSNSKK